MNNKNSIFALNINYNDIIMINNNPCKILEFDIIKTNDYPKIYVLGVDIFTDIKYNYYFTMTEKIIIPKINIIKCKILLYNNKKIWCELSNGELHEILLVGLNKNYYPEKQIIDLLEIDGKQKIISEHDIISNI